MVYKIQVNLFTFMEVLLIFPIGHFEQEDGREGISSHFRG